MENLSTNFYELSVTCEMNQYYHQYEMMWWWWGYMIVVLAVIISASITAVNWDSRGWLRKCNIVILVIAITSLMFTLYHYTFYKGMFNDWSTLRQNVDNSRILVAEAAPEDVLRLGKIYEVLSENKGRLNSREYAPKEWLLQQSFEKALRARGVEEKDIPKNE